MAVFHWIATLFAGQYHFILSILWVSLQKFASTRTSLGLFAGNLIFILQIIFFLCVMVIQEPLEILLVPLLRDLLQVATTDKVPPLHLKKLSLSPDRVQEGYSVHSRGYRGAGGPRSCNATGGRSRGSAGLHEDDGGLSGPCSKGSRVPEVLVLPEAFNLGLPLGRSHDRAEPDRVSCRVSDLYALLPLKTEGAVGEAAANKSDRTTATAAGTNSSRV